MSVFLCSGRLIGVTKNPSAEELHRFIMQRKVTYKDILKIDPARFDDLEQTMRMLYDHGELEI